MSYRLQLEGLLTEKRRKLAEIKLRADALVVDLHMACNPHLPVYDLPVDNIVLWTADLRKYVKQIHALKLEIKDIEQELGKESDG